MNVILHSTHCPRCRVLEAKLNLKNIQYEVNTDQDKMELLGIMSVPVLEVDGQLLQFKEATEWINKYKEA